VAASGFLVNTRVIENSGPVIATESDGSYDGYGLQKQQSKPVLDRRCQSSLASKQFFAVGDKPCKFVQPHQALQHIKPAKAPLQQRSQTNLRTRPKVHIEPFVVQSMFDD